MSVIGTNYTVVNANNAAVKLNDVTLAKHPDTSITWGDEITEEPVIGTDLPDQSTGKFRGLVNIFFMYSTDLNLTTLTEPDATGQVPVTTITVELTDASTPQKTDTWTFTARLSQASFFVRSVGNVMARLTGKLTAYPGRVQTP